MSSKSKEPKIIVLTPVRNEAWTLGSFLEAASVWADHIIVSDQNSTDESLEICRKFKKVKVIKNKASHFNERENRMALLQEARKIGDHNLIFCLDADERLTPAIFTKGFQSKLKNLAPGTAISIPFANIHRNLEQYWEVPLGPIAFRDDGRLPDTTQNIHFPRTTITNFKYLVAFEQLKLIHLQFIDDERVRSKHRWYQAWEWINTIDMQPIQIYRRYHHMNSIPHRNLKAIPNSWASEYSKHGIEIFAFEKRSDFWWDDEVRKWFLEFGRQYFQFLDLPNLPADLHVERAPLDKLMFFYLRTTQPFYRPNKRNPLFIFIYLLDIFFTLIWNRETHSRLLGKV